jgi:hypothetical protein
MKLRREAIANGVCPNCEAAIDETSFRDKVSENEFLISGLCQVCQDVVFTNEP